MARNAELLSLLAPQFEQELKERKGDQNFVEQVPATLPARLKSAGFDLEYCSPRV